MPSDPHQKARFLIDESLIAGIARDDERWLRRHTGECRDCARYEELTSRIVGELNSLAFEIDSGMSARVQHAIARHALRRNSAPHWRWGLAAAALLIAAAPIYKTMTDKRREAEIERADALLLERVDARLSQALPTAMEPLTAPAPAQTAPGGRIR